MAAMNALVVKIPDPKHVMSSRWSLLQGFGNAQYIFSRESPPKKNHLPLLLGRGVDPTYALHQSLVGG